MVVDDQPVVRAGFAAIIDAEPDLSVVGQAADGAAAVTLAAEVQPDVVLMDVRMPGMDGLTATRLLTASASAGGAGSAGGSGGADRAGGSGGAGRGIRVLVLTTFDLDEYVFEALRSGASGFMLKDARPGDLVEAIRVVASGDGMLAPTVTRRLIEAFASGAVAPIAPVTVSVLDALTPRELDVLMLMTRGLSNAEIGQELGVATGTVKAHVNAVLGKLGVRDRVQATIFAYDMGLVRPRPGPA